MTKELSAIRRLLYSAELIDAVRREVRAATNSLDVRVADGRVAGVRRYDVVVSNCDEGTARLVTRRIRKNVRGVRVSELVDGVLGVTKDG